MSNNTLNFDKELSSKDNDSKSIKISSILEGWVVEYDENPEKIKYRGEIFNAKNRTKITKYFIDYFVKYT